MPSELTMQEIYNIDAASRQARISDYVRSLPAILETALKERFLPTCRIFEYLDQPLTEDEVTFIQDWFLHLGLDIAYHPPLFFRRQGYIKMAERSYRDQDD